MKGFLKMIIAVLAFIFLLILGNWPSGGGIKDRWDDLMKWARKRNML